MRIALIGLGDIAQRVYLPLLAGRADLELVLVTRDAAKLDRLTRQYRVFASHTQLAAAIGSGLDAALVHAATGAHPELVRELLQADVPVYVDKPLANSFGEAAALVELAQARKTSLMVGFNRRFAPAYAALQGQPLDLLLLQKHRAGLADEPRRVIFDDFIHVVDTLRFLRPGPVSGMHVASKVSEGLLHQVVVQFTGDGWTAIGAMSRTSGGAEEVLEAIGPGSKRRIVNLADVVEYKGGEVLHRRGDWTPVARQRGIEQAVEHFLDAVRSGRRLDGAEALESHRVCEDITQAVLGRT